VLRHFLQKLAEIFTYTCKLKENKFMVIATGYRIFPSAYRLNLTGSGFDDMPLGSCSYLEVQGLQKLRVVH